MTHDDDAEDQTRESLDIDWWVMRTSGKNLSSYSTSEPLSLGHSILSCVLASCKEQTKIHIMYKNKKNGNTICIFFFLSSFLSPVIGKILILTQVHRAQWRFHPTTFERTSLHVSVDKNNTAGSRRKRYLGHKKLTASGFRSLNLVCKLGCWYSRGSQCNFKGSLDIPEGHSATSKGHNHYNHTTDSKTQLISATMLHSAMLHSVWVWSCH